MYIDEEADFPVDRSPESSQSLIWTIKYFADKLIEFQITVYVRFQKN